MRNSIFVLMTLFAMTSCGSDPRNPAGSSGALVDPSRDSKLTEIPTDVGNGVGQPTELHYQNPDYGVQFKLGPEWSVQSSGENRSKAVFVVEGTEDEIEINFRRNHFRDARKAVLGFGRSEAELENYDNVDLGLGFVALESKETIQVLVADRTNAFEVKSNKLAHIDKLLTTMTRMHPVCSDLELGRWVKYERRKGQDVSIVTLEVKEVDVVSGIARVYSSLEGSRQIRCESALALDFIQAEPVGLRSEPTYVELAPVIDINVNQQSYQAAQLTEVFKTSRDFMGLEILVDTYYAPQVPIMGVLKREISNQYGLQEVWSFKETGLGEVVVEEIQRVDYGVPLLAETHLTYVRMMSGVDRLNEAEILLNHSYVRVAYRAYDDLIRDLANDPRVLSEDTEVAKAYFGRALTKLFLVMERAEYQEFIQRMGYAPYLPSRQFFGPLGYLYWLSRCTKISNGQNTSDELSLDECKDELDRSQLAAYDRRGNRVDANGLDLLRLSELHSADVKRVLRLLAEDLVPIANDFDRAGAISSWNFRLPFGLHHGYTTYEAYQMEAKMLSGSVKAMVASIFYFDTYADLETPIGSWFNRYSNPKDPTIHSKLGVQLMIAFRNDFNRNFMRVANPEKSLQALKFMTQAFEDFYFATELAMITRSNYRRDFTTDLFVDFLRQYGLDVLSSLKSKDDIGDVRLSAYEIYLDGKAHQGLRIQAKKFFTNPFDMSMSEHAALIVYSDAEEGEEVIDLQANLGIVAEGRAFRFKMSKEFFKDYMDHFLPDWELLTKKPEVGFEIVSLDGHVSFRQWNQFDAWFPTLRFPGFWDFERASELYPRMDIAGNWWLHSPSNDPRELRWRAIPINQSFIDSFYRSIEQMREDEFISEEQIEVLEEQANRLQEAFDREGEGAWEGHDFSHIQSVGIVYQVPDSEDETSDSALQDGSAETLEEFNP